MQTLPSGGRRRGASDRAAAQRWSSVARPARSPDFRYSAAMKAAGSGGLVWTATTLDAFLSDPPALVPRSRMSFDGMPGTNDRTDLLAWLRGFSGTRSDLSPAEPTATPEEYGLDPQLLTIRGDPEYGAYLAGECTICHQSDAADEGIPSIVGWPPDDFVIALHAYKRGKRVHPIMQLVAGRLSDEGDRRSRRALPEGGRRPVNQGKHVMNQRNRKGGLSRRHFLASAAVATTALWAPTVLAQGRPRVVVVGGGAGGTTAARYIAKDSKGAVDVTLVEPSRAYYTCFFSNLYLGGFREFASIGHSYGALAARHGINVVHGLGGLHRPRQAERGARGRGQPRLRPPRPVAGHRLPAGVRSRMGPVAAEPHAARPTRPARKPSFSRRRSRPCRKAALIAWWRRRTPSAARRGPMSASRWWPMF